MADQVPEFLVTRDVILESFVPPIGTSTFFDMVNDGRIAKAKAPRGYYRLNETRKRLGMPPILERPVSEREKLSRRVLVQVALKVCLPHLILQPSELLDRRWLDQVDADELEKLVAGFDQELAAYSSDDEKLEYAQGVLDAAYLAEKKK